MFNWTNTSIPKITDIIDPDLGFNFFNLFTQIWVNFMGPYFYGAIIAVLGIGIYIKYNNATVAVVYFIIMNLLLATVMPSIVSYLIGILGSITIGILLYQLFVSKTE